MSKPKWDDAPAWAKWLARDLDGVWFWYENEPYISPRNWNVAAGEMTVAIQKIGDWRDTLEGRPPIAAPRLSEPEPGE